MAEASIMLVDDNPTFHRILDQFLKKHRGLGLSHWAENGRQAIEIARSEKPEVILLDLGMPEVSGLEILPILRAILPESIIIVLTLLDSESYRRASLQAGADGFVAKSMLNANLPALIEDLLAVDRSEIQAH